MWSFRDPGSFRGLATLLQSSVSSMFPGGKGGTAEGGVWEAFTGRPGRSAYFFHFCCISQDLITAWPY